MHHKQKCREAALLISRPVHSDTCSRSTIIEDPLDRAHSWWLVAVWLTLSDSSSAHTFQPTPSGPTSESGPAPYTTLHGTASHDCPSLILRLSCQSPLSMTAPISPRPYSRFRVSLYGHWDSSTFSVITSSRLWPLILAFNTQSYAMILMWYLDSFLANIDFYLFIFFFLGPSLRHMKIRRLGVGSKLQLPAYPTAVAM